MPSFPAISTIARPAPMLISSRLITAGQYTMADSDGIDTGSNSRISTYNQSGATVTKLRVIHPNWRGTLTNEQVGANPVTITSALEYPAGTFNQFLWSSASSISIASGNMMSDEITLSVPWPHDAQAWVRTYVTVSSGQTWVLGYFQNTAFGESVDSGTTTTDKTMSGTIANRPGKHGYSACALVGTAWSSPPRRFALAAIGDSLTQGPSATTDDRGNAGPWGRGCGWDDSAGVGTKVPFLNLAIGGQAANSNQPSIQMANRIELLKLAHVTHATVNYGTNDLTTDSPATVETSVLAVANFVRNNCLIAPVNETIPPKTTSSDGWTTPGGQTPVAPGYPVNYATLNDWVRTTPAPFVGYAATAETVETALNSGLWQTPQVTDDGTHWSVITTSPEVGGTFNARAAVIAKIPTWFTP